MMGYLRNTWPKVSITPKLHMLEDHVVEFIKRWGKGLGTYGEQGGESIHPTFNRYNYIIYLYIYILDYSSICGYIQYCVLFITQNTLSTSISSI